MNNKFIGTESKSVMAKGRGSSGRVGRGVEGRSMRKLLGTIIIILIVLMVSWATYICQNVYNFDYTSKKLKLCVLTLPNVIFLHEKFYCKR